MDNLAIVENSRIVIETINIQEAATYDREIGSSLEAAQNVIIPTTAAENFSHK